MLRLYWLIVGILVIGCTEYKLESSEDAGAADDTAEPTDDAPSELEDPPPEDLPYDGQITGRVCDPSGAEAEGWVVGAYVYVNYDSDGDGVDDARSEDSTDEAGRFRITGLPTGQDYTVFVVKGSFEATFEVTLVTGTYEIPEDECRLVPPNIAVISGDYDHIEDIIDEMGLDHTLIPGTFGTTEYRDFLQDPIAMAEFDIIFFNCGVSASWMGGEVERHLITENIRDFVLNGGSIYISDWAYAFVEQTFPAKIDFYGDDEVYAQPMVGREGTVEANVIDPTMQAVIGAVGADINFDLPMWVVVQSLASGVSPLLEATIEVSDLYGGFSTVSDVPIAARFDFGEEGGRVIYTAFHNEHAATTLDMTDILEEIILSL
jgi:hypothetical protein